MERTVLQFVNSRGSRSGYGPLQRFLSFLVLPAPRNMPDLPRLQAGKVISECGCSVTGLLRKCDTHFDWLFRHRSSSCPETATPHMALRNDRSKRGGRSQRTAFEAPRTLRRVYVQTPVRAEPECWRGSCRAQPSRLNRYPAKGDVAAQLSRLNLYPAKGRALAQPSRLKRYPAKGDVAAQLSRLNLYPDPRTVCR